MENNLEVSVILAVVVSDDVADSDTLLVAVVVSVVAVLDAVVDAEVVTVDVADVTSHPQSSPFSDCTIALLIASTNSSHELVSPVVM